jgi:hypothetical protein
MESREARTIRLKPSEIEMLANAARRRGLGWTTYARECLLTGHSFSEAQEQMKAHTRVTA